MNNTSLDYLTEEVLSGNMSVAEACETHIRAEKEKQFNGNVEFRAIPNLCFTRPPLKIKHSAPTYFNGGSKTSGQIEFEPDLNAICISCGLPYSTHEDQIKNLETSL